MAKLVKEFKKPISGESVFIGPDADKDIIIMALESSCDETACAIVKNGREVLANVVASQIKTHRLYGGVVPEVAAREHLDAVNLIIQEAFDQSGLTPDDITAVAATVGSSECTCLRKLYRYGFKTADDSSSYKRGAYSDN